MSKRMKIIVALAGAGLLAWIVLTTFEHDQVGYEVCVTFRGRSHCASASGRTREEAVRTAQGIACALLTSGRDENIVCLDSAPDTVRELPAR